MVLARALREVCGHKQDSRTRGRILPVQLGETQVVADRETGIPAFDIRHDRIGTRAVVILLAYGQAVGQVDLKQMDLAIGRRDVALTVDQNTGVVARVAGALDDAAGKNPGRPAGCDPGKPLHGRPVHGFGSTNVIVVSAANGEYFRQRQQVTVGRLGNETLNLHETLADVRPGGRLYDRYSQPVHGSSLHGLFFCLSTGAVGVAPDPPDEENGLFPVLERGGPPPHPVVRGRPSRPVFSACG